jgi:hypothetical protein
MQLNEALPCGDSPGYNVVTMQLIGKPQPSPPRVHLPDLAFTVTASAISAQTCIEAPGEAVGIYEV